MIMGNKETIVMHWCQYCTSVFFPRVEKKKKSCVISEIDKTLYERISLLLYLKLIYLKLGISIH